MEQVRLPSPPPLHGSGEKAKCSGQGLKAGKQLAPRCKPSPPALLPAPKCQTLHLVPSHLQFWGPPWALPGPHAHLASCSGAGGWEGGGSASACSPAGARPAGAREQRTCRREGRGRLSAPRWRRPPRPQRRLLAAGEAGGAGGEEAGSRASRPGEGGGRFHSGGSGSRRCRAGELPGSRARLRREPPGRETMGRRALR